MIRLKSLLFEQYNKYLSFVEKIDPSIIDLINNINGTEFYPENTILGQNGKIIRWVPEPKTKRRGHFDVFEVKPAGGIPFIRELGRITFRGQKSDSNIDIKVGSKLYKDGILPGLTEYGKTTLEQLNNIWSVDVNRTQQVLNIARQYVDGNKETFKKEFHKITRSQWAIKYWWNDTPDRRANLAGSQYIFGFYNKLNPIPKVIVDIIQDNELIKHLNYKVQNWNSEGNYPNNPIKVPDPVV